MLKFGGETASFVTHETDFNHIGFFDRDSWAVAVGNYSDRGGSVFA
jgi:hypothetical protein